jgi:topoisomerase-4 subunit A
MAKKKKIEDKTRYIPELLEDIMGSGFGRYAKYIIQERALPDARDGLKPVQRRILYAMYHDGNTWDHAYRKSAKTVGLVIGNYHPHGDTSVYNAMVRMSQDWKVRLPLIDMHGNNGSIDDDPAAAMRYTEVRLAKVTQVMEDDLDKDTVEMAPNFDDTENEPTVLPVPFPVMLVNGATGIAAGYATNMPPHNLGEVVDAAIYRLNNPDCTLDDLIEIIPGPDFPTGGIVQGAKGIKEAFATGRGRIVVRGKCQIVDARTCQQIVITEIPYEVIKAQLVKKIDEIRLSRDIDGIMDVRDESDRNGLRIVIDVSKDVDAEMVLNYLYKNTDLQIYYSYNNVAIIDKRPVQVGLIGLLDAFIAFRREVVLRRSHYELDRMEARCHIIEGLMKAVSILDEIIRIIRASRDKADAKKNLMASFGFDEPQAEAIVSLRLYRLSNTDIVQLRQEFAELVNQIEDTKAIIENPAMLNAVIVRELREVKKEYDDPRRTVIEDEVSQLVIDKTSMIANETVVVTISRDSYIKRVSLRSYRAVQDQPTGLKEGDMLVGTMQCDTVDTLLLFTSHGNYACLPVWQIEEGRWKDIGMHLNKVVRIEGDDKIIAAILVKDFHTYASIVTVSSGGYIKKTPVSLFKVDRNSKVMPCMNIGAESQLLDAFCVYDNDKLAMVSRQGYAYQFSVDQIPSTGIRSKGVKAMSFGQKDALAYGCAVHPGCHTVLFATAMGGLKRIKIEEIAELSRPARGSLICKKNKTNPSVLYRNMAVDAGSTIRFTDPAVHEIPASEIPLKKSDTGFSQTVDLHPGFLIQKGIEECRIIDYPEGEQQDVHDDVEKISLFDDGVKNG